MSRTARRKWTGGNAQGADLGIIITPMLDMAFQLLAFFIMTYHPPAREAIVDDQLLPAALKDNRPGTKGPPSTEKIDKDQKPPPKDVSNVEVWVRAVPSSGLPRKIEVSKISQKVFEVDVNAKRSYEEALNVVFEELKKGRDLPDEKDLPLHIRADRSLKFMYVAQLRDVMGKKDKDGRPLLNFKSISIGSK
jgi:biopolymer transport protein ExbD